MVMATHAAQAMARSPQSLRSHSVSSDKPSLSGMSSISPYLHNPTPEAAYIAPSAASHIVSTDQNEGLESFDDDPDHQEHRAPALVSVASLKLVNTFLDYILDCFLSSAGSLTLTALRPAVVKTLKPKLAEELIAEADNELEEYTGSMGEDDILPLASDTFMGLDWDSESAWRVMRLRCMVYATLGEFEESDMDFFLDNQGLTISDDQDAKIAIFLTAILEGVGEKVLRIAGQAAHHRGPVKRRPSSTSVISDQAGRLVVEELDTLKVASSPQLGRLWRAWRKTARSVTPSFSRQNLRGGMYRRSQHSSYTDGSRRSSIDSSGEYADIRPRSGIDETLAQFYEVDIAARVPLPNEQDEDEINGEETADGRSRRLASPTGRSRSMTSPPPQARAKQHHRTSSLPPSTGIFDSLSAAIFSTVGVNRVHEGENKNLPRASRRGAHTVSPPSATLGQENRSDAPAARTLDAEMDSSDEANRPELSRETIKPLGGGDVANQGDETAEDIGFGHDDRSFHKPQIVSYRKISMESARVPQIVETRSRASSKTKSIYSADSVGHSYDGEELQDPAAIGIARTHNGISPPPSRGGSGGRLLIVDDDTVDPALSSKPHTDRLLKDRGSTFVVAPSSEKKRRPEGLTIMDRGENGLRVHGGVPPPLTPLRELVEAAADTSDEASSVAPSQDNRSERDRSVDFLPYQQQSRGSDRSTYSPIDAMSAAHPIRTDSVPVGNHRVENDKSAVRPLPSPNDSRAVASHRPDSFGQGSRLTHSSSSGRALQNGRRGPTSDNDSLPSDQASSQGFKEAEARGKSFEELIRRDETLKYTLTPHSVRGITDAETPRPVVNEVDRNSRATAVGSHGHTSSNGTAKGMLNNLRPSSSLSSNTTMTTAKDEPPTVVQPPQVKKYIPVSRPPPPPTRKSTNGIIPREARLDGESTSSFADWIRSTGPKSSSNGSRNIGSSRSLYAQPQGSATRVNDAMSPTGLRPIIHSSSPTATDSRQRSRLQPRDPRTRSPSNAELIDAIRVGPPQNGARLDRTGDALRTSGGSGTDDWTAPSVASSLQSRSYAASNSSGTPLVAGTRTMKGQPSREIGVHAKATPTKLDPYNLGIGDGDDPNFALLRNSKRSEMSMMDFLKDGPSDGPKTSSVFDDLPPPPPAAPQRSAQGKAAAVAANGLRTRDSPTLVPATRNGARVKNAGPIYDKGAFGYDAQEAPGDARPPTTQPRAPPVATDIRSAQRTGTNDLADFFRNSAPPEPTVNTQKPPIKKESSGFGKMFGRKKAAAYV